VVATAVVVAAVAAAATESIALIVGISLKADPLATVPLIGDGFFVDEPGW